MHVTRRLPIFEDFLIYIVVSDTDWKKNQNNSVYVPAVSEIVSDMVIHVGSVINVMQMGD